MSTRVRVAIILASAVALGVTAYGNAWAILPPGSDREVWGIAVAAALVLAIVAVFLVDRWWALLPAVGPIAVSFYLYNLTGYSTPWDSESIGTPSEPIFYGVLLVLGIALHAAVLSIGLLLRRLWDVRPRRKLSTTIPKGMNR